MFKCFLENLFNISTEKDSYRMNGGHIIIKILGIKFKIKTLKVSASTKKEKIYNCTGIIAPNGIGDYLFVRPFFKYMKQSAKYKNTNFILFVQAHHYNFVKLYDSEYFKDIVVYNKNASQLLFNINEILKNYDFKSVINLCARPISSNLKFDKTRYDLVKKIKAKEKIADVILQNDKEINKKFSVYTRLIYTPSCLFELDRRRNFFSQLLDFDIPQEVLNITDLFNFNKKYITISLMAMNEARNYRKENWLKILNHILNNTEKTIQLLFIGSNVDYKDTEDIINCLSRKNRCFNCCGLTDISLVPIILKNSIFLLSPETGTVHIAESVGCETICLCGSAHYGRFVPHKKFVQYVFPQEFEKKICEDSIQDIDKYYFNNFEFPVTSINPDDVISVIDKKLEIIEGERT